MNVENFLDAIEVIVNKRVEENNTQIYTGKKSDVKEGISVKVFVPQGQMSQAFILI